MRVACLNRRAQDEKLGVAAGDTFDIVAFELLSSESSKAPLRAVSKGTRRSVRSITVSPPALPFILDLTDRAIASVSRGYRSDVVV